MFLKRALQKRLEILQSVFKYHCEGGLFKFTFFLLAQQHRVALRDVIVQEQLIAKCGEAPSNNRNVKNTPGAKQGLGCFEMWKFRAPTPPVPEVSQDPMLGILTLLGPHQP